jgi:pyroglutamyl-peptidase
VSNSNQLVVLTGFEPFADFHVNPSWEGVKPFDEQEIRGFKIKAFKMSLVYKQIKPVIERIIDTWEPSIMISFGQSYRPVISLEKVALNFADLTNATILYNCRTRPKDEILDPEAPHAYFTTLPIRKILHHLHHNNIPAEISYTAGTFGCNQAFFHAMHKIHSDRLDTRTGFIHVPCLPSQAAQLQSTGKKKPSSMSLETTIKAVDVIIKTTIDSIGKD